MATRLETLRKVLSGTQGKWKNPTERPGIRAQRRVFDTFSRAATSLYNQALAGGIERNERVKDYEEMDQSPEVSQALNIYADDACTYSELDEILRIESNNERIQRELEELFYERLDIEFHLWQWIRNMVKYGDHFNLLDIVEKDGVLGSIALPVVEIEREEGFDGDPNSLRFRWTAQGNTTFESFQISHMRILGDDRYLPYGRSALDPARKIWKQLQLGEDAMMIYRIVRAPERRVFYVDVANIPPNDVEQYILSSRDALKRTPLITESTGQIDYRFNPMPIAGYTEIPLLNGEKKTIKELANDYDNGIENWVYSVQDETNKIVPGKVKWCGKNYVAKKLIRVHLDNKKYIDSAPEHPFMLRDGSNKRADQLTINDSLMPFYTNKDKKGYEKIYDPSEKKYEYTHKLIAKDIYNEEYKIIEKPTVHHKNFVKENRELYSNAMKWNIPEECIEIAKDKLCKNNTLTRDKLVNELKNDIKFIKLMQNENTRKINKFNPRTFATKIREIYGYSNFSDFKKSAISYNHKVTNIEIIENISEDVYCMTVVGNNNEDDRHNFAVDSGIFVMNSIDEDFFIPVRGDRGSRIETLPGGTNQGDIDDIQYIQQKMFIALGVPKSYLQSEEDLGGKGTLAQEDIKFARTIQRIQKIVVSELGKMALIHLHLRGFQEEDLYNFTLRLTNPSTVMEMMQLDLVEKRFNLAVQQSESTLMDDTTIKKDTLKMSDHEIAQIDKNLYSDARKKYVLAQLQEEGGDPPADEFGSNSDNNQDQQQQQPSASPSTETGKGTGGNPMLPPDPAGTRTIPGMKDISNYDNSLRKPDKRKRKRRDAFANAISDGFQETHLVGDTFKYNRDIELMLETLDEGEVPTKRFKYKEPRYSKTYN